ncbi:hypothetical protein V6Z90_001132 [Aspergillus fumigatus]
MQDSIRFTPTPTVSYTTTTHWDIRSRSEKEVWAILEDKRDFRHAKEVLRSQGLDQSGVNSPTLFKGIESKNALHHQSIQETGYTGPDCRAHRSGTLLSKCRKLQRTVDGSSTNLEEFRSSCKTNS